ncbi:MAG: fibronectin type III domain-containing protein, partial [Methanophagales archaeon]|nr:fibronectin type III domain-containing protein [Methanophagales archaeon]
MRTSLPTVGVGTIVAIVVLATIISGFTGQEEGITNKKELLLSNYPKLFDNDVGNFNNIINNAYKDDNNIWNILIGGPYLGGSRWTVYTESNTNGSGNIQNGGDYLLSTETDTTPPESVSDLDEIDKGSTWILWNCTNPIEPDFDYTAVWLDGTFKANITTPEHLYNATGLEPDTSYEIGTRTVDNSSNVNPTWVNDTATTLPAPDTTPLCITNVNATSITNDSATITWNTDEISDSLVKYGTESGNYTLSVSNASLVLEHSVVLTGLNANTTYYYVVNSTDSSGNHNESAEYNFTTLAEEKADTIPPIISFVSPTPSNNSVVNKSYIFINVTANEELSTAILEWNGTNETMQGSGTNRYINKTGLTNGTYIYRVYANDSADNWGVPEIRVVTIVIQPFDTTPPTITITSPIDGTTYTTNSVSLNYSVSEPTAWEGYSLDGAENVALYGNTTLTNLTDGLHNITVYANDTSGNMGQSTVWFAINVSIQLVHNLNTGEDFSTIQAAIDDSDTLDGHT